MKKLFSDAINGIKGLFSRKSGTQPAGKAKSADECRNRKPSASFEHIWKGIRTFFSRYKVASVCGAALILAAIVVAVGIGIGNGTQNAGGVPASSDAYAQAGKETPRATELLTGAPERNDGSSNMPGASAEQTPKPSDVLIADGAEHTVVHTTTTPEPDIVVRGEHSELIPEVQAKLMELWYMDADEPTDYFGSITEGAIRAFQRRNELDVNGRLDVPTYNQLMSINAKVYMTVLGDEGEDVVDIQSRLFELGYLTDYSKGIFDETTETAVVEFQKANMLSVDGKVGKETKEALYSPDAVGKGYVIGDVGEEIEAYQERLQELGYLTTTPDGIFGKDTQIAVKRFQSQNDLIENGYLGPTTRKKLMSDDAVGNALHYGMQGSDVQNIQQRLYALNYLRAKDVNGYFTSLTEKAVKLFQKNCGIQQDGKVGRYTMSRLFADDAPKASSPVSSGNSGGGNGGGNNGGNNGGGNNGGGNNGGGSDVQSRIERFIRVANNKVGSRYVRGGKGPNVFDCSGFVYWCLNQAGVNQSYMTSSMWAHCTKYQRNNSFGNIKRGDVIVFKGHVAISLGNGMMIDASQSKGQVVIRSNQSSYWRNVFICSFRIFR